MARAPRRADRNPANTAQPPSSGKNVARLGGQRVKDTVAVAAHVAQVFLVAVAIFGYFYTVMPIYKKQLLADGATRQQEIVAGLEARNAKLLEQIRENSETLDEQYGTIAKTGDHVAILQKETQDLSKENAKILEENAKALQDKKDIEMELAYLRDEAASGRKTLLALETDLAQKYRHIFYESMEDHAVAQFLALHKNRVNAQKDKRGIDIISDYKDKTLPVAALIEKSLNDYDRKLSKSYVMIPTAMRKKLADESKDTLAKRDDLKAVPFDTAKIVELLNERDNRVFALPSGLSQSERVKLITQIGRDYNEKITDLIREFKHDYIKEVRDFFEG